MKRQQTDRMISDRMNGKRQRRMLLGLAAAGVIVSLAGCSFSRPTDSKEPSQTESTEPTSEPSQTETIESQPEPQTEPSASTGEEPTTIPSFPDEESESGTDESGDSEHPDEEMPEEPEVSIIHVTDIHYLAGSLTDGGSSFQYMVEHGDGKVVTYIDQITDAFVEEVIRRRPDVVIISGDLTLDGEKKSHEELAQKLYQIEDEDIPVLVIPGNHDINNHHAARFEGEERLPAEFTTPAEFREIYRDFGYDEAISEDYTSLSYVYELDEDTRFLMLDTCQYRQKALVGGAILTDTYDWIEKELENAWDDGADVIPVAHHNLLDESEIYIDDCTIEHSEQLVDMLEEWDVPLFLSGHLHVQHAKRSEENRGIFEMVTSSLATPACQFGDLSYWHGGSFAYKTRVLDVQGWARRNGRKEKDLLEFDRFKKPFLRRVFYNQSYDELCKISTLSEDQRVRMSNLYSDLNYHYYQGTAYTIKDAVLKNPDYQLWMGDGYSSILADYVQYIVSDANDDYNAVMMH
ncbi:MAG: metallophosphoesterase [Eubacteriales bacterium]|nr:metallophosphoesterase [Eubacteriales bacterium]